MKVSGHQIEWGYEAIAAWPHAYWHYLNGTLTETESGPDSECVYWYSPKHTIRTDERCWANMKEASDLPNLWIHKDRLDWSEWIPPPLADHFYPKRIEFDKPTVVICNRANIEWGRAMINYLDTNVLRDLLRMLCDKYQVVYINVRGKPELEDEAKAIDIGDYDMIRSEFPDVKIIHDIIENGSFNETQCRIFAGCSRFITMNGGHSIMCSYFGGENIIYSKECKELRSTVNSFYNWYDRFGGSEITVVNDYASLLNTVLYKWVSEDPKLNILLRCHDRKRQLQRTVDSIKNGGYVNYRVIASYDNESTWRHLRSYPFQKVAVLPEKRPSRPDGDEYRSYLPSNCYLNQLMDKVDDGYILFMDDDDYYEQGALSKISSHLEEDTLLIWRVRLPNGEAVPKEDEITPGNISGIGFAFHSKHKHLAKWEPWRRGDYRVAKNLSKYLKVKFIPDVLSIVGKKIPREMGPEWIAEKRAEYAERAAKINEERKKKRGQ